MKIVSMLMFTLGCTALLGCESLEVLPAPTPKLIQYYQQSIADAAVIEPEEVLPVPRIVGKTGRFVTWTAYPDSYVPGQSIKLQWGETWVALDGEVHKQCRLYDNDEQNIRIQQLLGLPPEPDAKRFFVVLEVDTQDMFRPCANPDLQATECSAAFPAQVSQAHKAWFASQTATAYHSKGYPWTRLGYTYNWNPKAADLGVYEFVIRQGAQVNVVSVAATADYCR